MTDERFDHDLRQVLRRIAGEEAPMSLRNRLVEILDEAPVGRRLWFAVPQLKLAMAVATAAAVLVLAFMLAPRDAVGPGPTETQATPTTSVEPSATQTVTPEPSAEPTTAPTAWPTRVPTPTPTPVPAAWTALEWSDPVPHAFQGAVQDVEPWGDGYVAVTGVWGDGTTAAEFLSSTDGLHWTVELRLENAGFHVPRFLVPFGGGLLAVSYQESVETPSVSFGPPLLWWSADGRQWSSFDSGSLGDILDGLGIVDVASAPSGLVIVGTGYESDGAQGGGVVVAHSTDGHAWSAGDLTSTSGRASVSAVRAYGNAFVIVGKDGADPMSEEGLPAAWYSDDAANWSQASLDGAFGPGEGFSSVQAGAGGLIARSSRQFVVGAPTGSWWHSVDGRSWQQLDDLAVDLGSGSVQSDGARMVALSAGAWVPQAEVPWPGLVKAWASADGLAWRELAVTGVMTEESAQGWWVVPDGVVYVGQEGCWFGAID